MLQAFAYWEKTPDCEYRWGTLLVSNGDEKIVGNAVLKNPGSARPLELSSSREDGRLRFSVDLSMVSLAELFGIDKTGGTIRIFNLSCIREADFSKAKKLITNHNAKDEDVASEILNGPAVQTYIGWGDFYKEPLLRDKAEMIFEAAKKNTPSLKPNIEDNLFFHPLYLMHYGRNRAECLEIVASFKQESSESTIKAPQVAVNELYLISTYQSARLLDVNTDFIRRLLEKKELEYVRDSERVFRISLDSVLDYARYHKFAIDEDYLKYLNRKINPWREIETSTGIDISTRTKPATDDKGVSGLSPELLKMGFCPRALNAFKKNGITTIEQLTNLRATDLMRFHYFGRKALKNVRAVLSENGLSLKDSRSQ